MTKQQYNDRVHSTITHVWRLIDWSRAGLGGLLYDNTGSVIRYAQTCQLMYINSEYNHLLMTTEHITVKRLHIQITSTILCNILVIFSGLLDTSNYCFYTKSSQMQYNSLIGYFNNRYVFTPDPYSCGIVYNKHPQYLTYWAKILMPIIQSWSLIQYTKTSSQNTSRYEIHSD